MKVILSVPDEGYSANIYVLVMKMFVLFYIIAVFFDEDWLILF
jgi:hypothetical protein